MKCKHEYLPIEFIRSHHSFIDQKDFYFYKVQCSKCGKKPLLKEERYDRDIFRIEYKSKPNDYISKTESYEILGIFLLPLGMGLLIVMLFIITTTPFM